MQSPVGFELILERAKFPRGTFLDVAENADRLIWLQEIPLDGVRGVKEHRLAVAAGEKKEGKVFVRLDLFAKMLMRLPAQPPEPKHIFCEKIQVTKDRLPYRCRLVRWWKLLQEQTKLRVSRVRPP